MKREISLLSYALLAAGAVVLILVIISAWPFFEFVVYDAVNTKKQMEAGKEYMDSLTDKDIQAWIQRTQAYLKEDPTNFELGVVPVPSDLQKLGILGIEVFNTNEIYYVWLGGMDNTALAVERITNGNFQVTAIYTPYSSRVIWPRQ